MFGYLPNPDGVGDPVWIDPAHPEAPVVIACAAEYYEPPILTLSLVQFQYQNDPLARYKVRIALEEGRRNRAYCDMFNNVTIGIGHNMGTMGQEVNRPQFETATRADYMSTKTGRNALADPQVDNLFEADLRTALDYAPKLVANFDNLPPEAREVVVDLTFHLGPSGFRQFKDLRTALSQQNWKQAAWDLSHKNRQANSPPSSYHNQVPHRSTRNVTLLNGLAVKQTA